MNNIKLKDKNGEEKIYQNIKMLKVNSESGDTISYIEEPKTCNIDYSVRQGVYDWQIYSTVMIDGKVGYWGESDGYSNSRGPINNVLCGSVITVYAKETIDVEWDYYYEVNDRDGETNAYFLFVPNIPGNYTIEIQPETT